MENLTPDQKRLKEKALLLEVSSNPTLRALFNTRMAMAYTEHTEPKSEPEQAKEMALKPDAFARIEASKRAAILQGLKNGFWIIAFVFFVGFMMAYMSGGTHDVPDTNQPAYGQ